MNFAGTSVLRRAAENEAELVRLAKARDAAVWSTFHDQYYGMIYRYAYARLRSHEDAEDVASQVFIEALKGIDRYRDGGRPILAWFYGIASHLVSRRRREAARLGPLSETGSLADEEPWQESSSLTRIAIYEALDRLKAEHREVLVLRYLMDMPTRHVAELLGKSEAATYSLQVRALGAMRRAMSP
jgi:RNA polymerase sigma-70 factor (ECF subfamily)